MSFISNASLATNIFRVSYQACEAASFTALNIGNAIPSKFYLANKVALAILDAFSSHLRYMNLSQPNSNLKDLLNIGEAVCRLVDIYESIYLLRTQPHLDRSYLQQTILLNLLNIQRLAVDAILRHNFINTESVPVLKYAAVTCSVLDTALRMYTLFSQRISIQNQIIQFYQNINFARIGQGIDYVGRGIGHTCCVVKSFATGAFMISMATNFTNPKLVALAPLTLAMTAIAKINISKIFDMMAVQRGLKRNLAEWTIAIASSTTLVAAAAVGWGLAPSISEIFRRILPGVLIIGLFSTLSATITIGVRQIFNDLGFQQSMGRDVAEFGIAGISASHLSSAIAVGLLGQTARQVGDSLMSTLSCGLGLFGFYSGFQTARDLIVNGPTTWNEIFNNLRSFC